MRGQTIDIDLTTVGVDLSAAHTAVAALDISTQAVLMLLLLLYRLK